MMVDIHRPAGKKRGKPSKFSHRYGCGESQLQHPPEDTHDRILLESKFWL